MLFKGRNYSKNELSLVRMLDDCQRSCGESGHVRLTFGNGSINGMPELQYRQLIVPGPTPKRRSLREIAEGDGTVWFGPKPEEKLHDQGKAFIALLRQLATDAGKRKYRVIVDVTGERWEVVDAGYLEEKTIANFVRSGALAGLGIASE